MELDSPSGWSREGSHLSQAASGFSHPRTSPTEQRPSLSPTCTTGELFIRSESKTEMKAFPRSTSEMQGRSLSRRVSQDCIPAAPTTSQHLSDGGEHRASGQLRPVLLMRAMPGCHAKPLGRAISAQPFTEHPLCRASGCPQRSSYSWRRNIHLLPQRVLHSEWLYSMLQESSVD